MINIKIICINVLIFCPVNGVTFCWAIHLLSIPTTDPAVNRHSG
jgi:hypothetical protein